MEIELKYLGDGGGAGGHYAEEFVNFFPILSYRGFCIAFRLSLLEY